jgi:hypothetical protein
MVSVRFDPDGSATVRLHEDFRKAPISVIDALCCYLNHRRRSDWAPVQEYAQQIVPREQTAPGREAHRSQVHDLARIAKQVNERYFNGRVRVRVRWGKAAAARGRRRSIRYGSWNASSQEVRIHPALDDTRVPEAFVAFIVYHEFLHVVLPDERQGGRRVMHGRTFLEMERKFPDYEKMEKLAAKLVRIIG